jgi:hypothetical protein
MERLNPLADPSVYQGGVWPTERQQLLLQSALLAGPAATEAWAKWREMAPADGLAGLDDGSSMLIPMVHVNLKRLGVRDPLLLEAKQSHFHHWRSNQKLFQNASDFLDELREEEVPALVLKGVALANLYYPDTGCRPMADLDILVPTREFVTLGNHLLNKGWKETDGHSFAGFRTERMPSFGFMRPDGFWVDLHCHVLHANCAEGADDGFWSHARAWSLRQTETLTLAPEDHLLHVVSHGVRWCDVPPFRWIADAWWILARSRGSFDWERFLEQARFHKINLPVFRGLEFMNRIAPPGLPPDVLTRLEGMPVSAGERVRYVVETHPIPKPFFSRAKSVWRALGEDEAARTVMEKGGKRRSGLFHAEGIRRASSLMLFAVKVVLRDHRQILAEMFQWVGLTSNETQRNKPVFTAEKDPSASE